RFGTPRQSSATDLYFFSSRRRHTRFSRDWSSDVCSSDLLRDALAHPSASGAIDVSTDEAADLIEPFGVLLDVVGDGVALTGAGYLKPAAVEQIAHHTGITEWWIGKANREDRKSTRLNSSHVKISYAVFCLKK